MVGAEGWQMSNAPVFNMAVHRASLDLFKAAGFSKMREKSMALTAYLEFILDGISREVSGASFEVITPSDPDQRGCQLSVLAHGKGKSLFDALTAKGVIVDWREPNVIRMAPVPLYNSFEDIYHFGALLRECLAEA
jgi:kynureninase